MDLVRQYYNPARFSETGLLETAVRRLADHAGLGSLSVVPACFIPPA